mmetsp:Transcript_21764/g.37049  ORF Transcript_21764/g.37049 Transcript_21764/m.37049 type:complete len:586 (-) Transcript_21764:238-1995(-)
MGFFLTTFSLFIFIFILPSVTSRVGGRPGRTFAEIAGYAPFSIVTDANAIDLDLQLIETELFKSSEDSFRNALQIYQNGGHTASIATLTLTSAISGPVAEGTRVAGLDSLNRDVIGEVSQDYPVGATELNVLYVPTSNQQSYLECLVGGLTVVNQSQTSGCFVPSGSISISNGGNYQYQYKVSENNRNAVTLASFSLDLVEPQPDTHPTLEKFFDYYGDIHYGDAICRAALQSAGTSNLQRGRVNFQQIGYQGRTEGATLSMVLLNVWMEVRVQMRLATDMCKTVGGETPEEHWDRAVAYYTGSLEGTLGDGTGRLLHQLADDMCVEFRTCGRNSDERGGRSYVNREILTRLRTTQDFIENQQCGSVELAEEEIEIFMIIPLVQGTLKYAYLRSVEDSEINESAGAIFAASILPLVHACDQNDAATISRNLGLGSTSSTDFTAVKTALENNYECLRLTCKSVGGYFDSNINDYYASAFPCVDGKTLIGGGSTGPAPAPTPELHSRQPTETSRNTVSPQAGEDGGDDSNKTAVIAGSVSAVLVVTIALLAFLFFQVRRNKESDPERQGNAPEFTPAGDTKESAEMT